MHSLFTFDDSTHLIMHLVGTLNLLQIQKIQDSKDQIQKTHISLLSASFTSTLGYVTIQGVFDCEVVDIVCLVSPTACGSCDFDISAGY